MRKPRITEFYARGRLSDIRKPHILIRFRV